MVKRTFIICSHKTHNYRLYTDDITVINKRIRKSTPRLPSYNEDRDSKNYDSNTEVEFEPLEIYPF